jgi:putative ABC transport system permease protein
MLSSLRHAVRVLRKAPGFTIVAVLTLALGIGANTAIFSVVNALLLRSLPLEDPARLAALSADYPQRGVKGGAFSVAAYETLRDGNHSFNGIVAYAGEGFTLLGAGEPERLPGARVSPNFLDVLGTRPVMGRGFRTEEGIAGARPVALIGYSLWQRRFGADPHVLGKPVTLNQEVYSIVGVMPPDYAFPVAGTDIWVTRVMNYSGFQPEQIRSGAGFLQGIARLRPGVSIEQAAAELAVLSLHYREQHPGAPDADPHTRMALVPLQENLVAGLRKTLLVLTGAVGLVLLIACANVASLMMARATGRAREIALRTALGATRASIVRHLLIESSLLAIAGAVLGAIAAQWGVAWLVKADAGNTLPGFQPIRVDWAVLGFTLAISLITGIAFGLAPAVQVSRPDLNSVLRDSGWGTTTGGGRHRTRSLLVAGQMALSIVLLIGAGLLLESFRNLRAVNPGFNPHNALTMDIQQPLGKTPADPRRNEFIHEAIRRLSAIPGVRSATASYSRPMGLRVYAPILADGQPNIPIAQRPLAIWNAITPGYFETYGVPLVSGRDITWADDEKAPQVVVVSQSLAHRFWPQETPLGKHLVLSGYAAPFEIVGVAGDTKNRGLQSDPGMVAFTSYAQRNFGSMAVTIRTEADPAGFARAATTQLHAVDKDLPVTNLQTVDALMAAQVTQERQTVLLIGGFAAVALLLALIGLYGVMAYSVAQRTAEIGIRQAVGAQRGDILRLVFGQAVRVSLAGIAIGIVGAAGLTRLLAGMLFHVSATDPATFAATAMLFLAVAMLAAYVPAWRATRVDPVEALRQR